MPETTRQNRILGALLALHAGDSLGATVEFEPWARIRHYYPTGLREIIGGGTFNWRPGDATDDTDLTRAVLLAYVQQSSQETVYDTVDEQCLSTAKLAGMNMLSWLNGPWPGRKEGSHPLDIGTATLVGLRKFKTAGCDPRAAGAGHGQRGNGSLMRCIPTGLLVRDQARRIKESMLISAITHDDEVCQIACAVYNEIVAKLIDLDSTCPTLSRVHIATDWGTKIAMELEETAGEQIRSTNPVSKAITSARNLSLPDLIKSGPQTHPLFPGAASGYVIESLILSLAAIHDTRTLEEILVDIVRVGSDTDTNAAIAGGLVGARDGVGAIPTRWRDKLQYAKEFEELVNKEGIDG